MQHLAACTIAKTLAETQATDAMTSNKIEIVAQDPHYTERREKILADLDPPIKIVSFETFGALQAVDCNTIIVSIGATAGIVEAAIEVIGPEGPAGLLGQKMTFNAEEDLADEEIPVFAKSYRYGQTTEIEWRYKAECYSEPITGDEWFGAEPRDQYISQRSALWDDTGELLRDATGMLLWNDVPDIPMLERMGNK
jgi:hypothetical protein